MEDMGAKRYYFQTEETVTTTRKGYLLVEEDFTQLYDSILNVATLLKQNMSLKLLLWMGKEMSDMNAIAVGKTTFESFNKYLKATCVECSVSRPTFDRCISELLQHKILTKVGKGFYYLNPHFLWKGTKEKRIRFLQDEQREGRYVSHNPNDTDKKEEIDL